MNRLVRNFKIATVSKLAELLGVSDHFDSFPYASRAMKEILPYIQKTLAPYPDYKVSVGFIDNNPEDAINLIRVDYHGPHPLSEDRVPMTNTHFTIQASDSRAKPLKVTNQTNTYQSIAIDKEPMPPMKHTRICDINEAKGNFKAFCSFTWDANGQLYSARLNRALFPNPAERMPA